MDPIRFELFGLHLQEPMAVITNWMIALFCFYAFFRLKQEDEAAYWWRLFYLVFGVSTFFGGLGHAFFYYCGVAGKYPCWTLGCLANVCAARGMLAFRPYAVAKPTAVAFIWIKSATLLVVAIGTQKFLYVTIDAILTYIAYTGIFAGVLIKRGVPELRWMVIGVLVLLPSAFIFLLKLNVHRWLNKDDLSHLLMLSCIYCFYRGMAAWGERSAQQPENV